MKKTLLVLLCASLIAPSFAFAQGNSGHGDNGGRRGFPVAKMIHLEKKEIKSLRNDNDHDGRFRFATTTPPIIVKKTNYFFCVTATGWNVTPVDAGASWNSQNTLGQDCVKLPANIAKKLQALSGTATTTPPVADTTAPVISSLVSSSVTSTSATISWTTDESANGTVYVSTSTPVNTATATAVTSAYSTTHSFNITSLTPNTTYYYVVKSADVSNNTATSVQQSFVTPVLADTTAPIISGISISGIASSTATIAWNTNELATGKLYYGTSTPLSTFVYTPALSLTHLFNLTGLNATTTYQLLFESSDAANNVATTTSSFITTN